MRRSAAWVAVTVALVLAWLVYGLLTMTDPAPRYPQPEGSPAYTGQVDAPEVGPAS